MERMWGMITENKNLLIFIISGKAKAGKDTTASIIKNYGKENNLKVINLQFSSYIKIFAKLITDWDGKEETKPRSLLQELGTEIIREKIDNYFFINRIIQDIKVCSYYADIITISDARLPEELDSISNAYPGSIKMNIIRPIFENDLSNTEKNHITEKGLDNYHNYDYIVSNDGTIEELKNKVENILNNLIKEGNLK